jgi:hypothetical protein
VALHDPLAVLEATVSGTLTTAPMALQVVCDHGRDRGAVRPHNGPQRPVQVACDADLSSINAMILHRLGTLR